MSSVRSASSFLQLRGLPSLCCQRTPVEQHTSPGITTNEPAFLPLGRGDELSWLEHGATSTQGLWVHAPTGHLLNIDGPCGSLPTQNKLWILFSCFSTWFQCSVKKLFEVFLNTYEKYLLNYYFLPENVTFHTANFTAKPVFTRSFHLPCSQASSIKLTTHLVFTTARTPPLLSCPACILSVPGCLPSLLLSTSSPVIWSFQERL